MAIVDTERADEIAQPVGEGGPRLRSLTALKRMYEDSAEAQQDARILAFRDRDWYDNANESHWSPEEKQELKDRGQPPVTMNDIKRNVNFLIGYEQRTRSDPRAFPRSPGKEQAADVVTDVLDFIEHKARFDKTASGCFRELVVEGIEAAEVVIERGDEVVINRIAFDKFFYDPRSRENDFSDARWLGYVDWFDVDEAQEMFPEKADEISSMMDMDDGQTAAEFEDRPSFWSDRGRQRVKIAVVYYRISMETWAYAYVTSGVVLSEGVSPYMDEDGYPCCPIIAQSCYVTRNNERFGVVRDMISPQREKNWRRSIALYLVRARRMWASDESIFPNPDKAKKEASRADGLVIGNGQMGQDWGFIDNMGEASAHLRMSEMSSADLDRLGPNRAMAGETPGASGRAIALQQNAGLTEENNIYDLHLDWKLRVYRAMWARAKQFWTEPKYIRVSDNEDAYRFLAVNQPEMVQTPMGPQMVMQNALAEMDVDITIQAVQDALTLQYEQFETMVQTLPILVNAPPQYTRMLIEMAPNLREKDRMMAILEEMEQAQQQQAQQQAQVAQMQMQAAMAMQQVNMEKTQSETVKNVTQAQKTQVDTQAEALENQIRQITLGQQWNARVNVGV